MNNLRRNLLKGFATLAALTLLPLRALAAEWNKVAFDAKTLPEALKGAGIQNAIESKDIVIRAPDIAENSAVVPVEVNCKIPNTRSISIFADKNPQPLVAQFNIADGVEPYVSTRIKMGDTGNIRVIVQADGKNYVAMKEVKVTIGGCG
ncbi:MAG: thiosulfate oxidation carrier protein SoxY [Burkholderiales bacterium]